ncbi:hypothetical protein [Candidatus Nitrosotenuis cloacae]|uniref:hypothetical protein n=1 Tax=Candidatus Nitrosotenuis cloacae TaxID=1603555 RepID=UPI002281FD7E|nr:hypothetical protein [Candidatus Nitrosotenuis cloacae]
MSAARRIADAERILEEIRSAKKDATSQIMEFLKAIQESYTDLLEEYNKKFDCKIDRIGLDKFKAKAKKTGNVNAISFLMWYEREYRRIRNDSELGRLLERDLAEIDLSTDKIIDLCSLLLENTRRIVYHAYENF